MARVVFGVSPMVGGRVGLRRAGTPTEALTHLARSIRDAGCTRTTPDTGRLQACPAGGRPVSFYTRQADELRRRGRVRADHARYLAGRLGTRALRRRAWTLARAGGTVRAYFAEALRQSWAETK